MKAWRFTYTEDNGKTYKKMTTEAETYSNAYLATLLKIAMGGMITDRRRIKQRYRITNKKDIKHVF